LQDRHFPRRQRPDRFQNLCARVLFGNHRCTRWRWGRDYPKLRFGSSLRASLL